MGDEDEDDEEDEEEEEEGEGGSIEGTVFGDGDCSLNGSMPRSLSMPIKEQATMVRHHQQTPLLFYYSY